MVRPTRPKEIKPKAEMAGSAVVKEFSSGLEGNKLIIVNTITTIIICILFIGSNYFLQDKLLSSKMSKLSAPSDQSTEEAPAEEDAAPERGIILDLGEFILNLSDSNARRYLKVNVALELTKLPTDPDASKGGGGGEGHGEGADPMKAIELEMGQYKPAVRDSIISTLSSKTAEELLSTPGKELAKEQIKEAVNGIFNGEREVLRVSFGNFIIQ
ncbi:MAG: flagellar basal body-associated FliL family protein [Candidatus Gastranaerophilaceae bacterium]|jgi:flagellar FliL protein